jgi:hypothetical protein
MRSPWMRSTGATRCDLYQDGTDLSVFMLISDYPTWGEHLRHHTGRMTGADRQFHDDAAALAVGPPEVKHLFALSAPGA